MVVGFYRTRRILAEIEHLPSPGGGVHHGKTMAPSFCHPHSPRPNHENPHTPKVDIVQKIHVDGEVDRARCMPQNPMIIAAKTVLLKFMYSICSPSTACSVIRSRGSPLLWVGVGVAFSVASSWSASYLKKYVMQQAFKTMMGQVDTQNNQFANADFSPGSPFPFAPSPMQGSTASSAAYPFPFPPPPPPLSATSAPPSQRTLTVDVPPTKTEAPPTVTKSVDGFESLKKTKKSAFFDVSPEETLTTSPFENFKETTETKSPKESQFANADSVLCCKVDENENYALFGGRQFDPPQKMIDLSIEVTDENHDLAQTLKSKAIDAISEGKLNEAIDQLTEAIMLNPSPAILYATRRTSNL